MIRNLVAAGSSDSILITALQTYRVEVPLNTGRFTVCLTFPGRVVEVNGEFASVDYGPEGTRHNINVSLVNASLGSYVLVQSGFAVKLLSEREAKEALEMWDMIRELQSEST
jgi:hydrogenase expression/formation protein HypC